MSCAALGVGGGLAVVVEMASDKVDTAKELGLAISARTIYALMVSTHYPSAAIADEGGPIYYQEQVLARVPRAEYGSGY